MCLDIACLSYLKVCNYYLKYGCFDDRKWTESWRIAIQEAFIYHARESAFLYIKLFVPIYVSNESPKHKLQTRSPYISNISIFEPTF